MKAVGYFKSHPQSGVEELRDIEIPSPVPTGRDLLVKIVAAAVNPVDVKTKMRTSADEKEEKYLGSMLPAWWKR